MVIACKEEKSLRQMGPQLQHHMTCCTCGQCLSRGVPDILPSVQGKGAMVDPLLPDVLVFPPRADLHDHPLVKNGSLILQVSHPS